MTVQVTPAELSRAVMNAVSAGIWSPAEVTGTVTAAVPAGRSDVVATLWDLVDDGTLVYDPQAPYGCFRIAVSAAG